MNKKVNECNGTLSLVLVMKVENVVIHIYPTLQIYLLLPPGDDVEDGEAGDDAHHVGGHQVEEAPGPRVQDPAGHHGVDLLRHPHREADHARHLVHILK